MKKQHEIGNVRFHNSKLTLSVDGEGKTYDLSEISDILARASEEELNTYDVSPSGYGIHWPLLDEDLSVDGLLGIRHDRNPNQREESKL